MKWLIWDAIKLKTIDDAMQEPVKSKPPTTKVEFLLEVILPSLALLAPEDRELFFTELRARYCQHCGGERVNSNGEYCQCNNDE